MPPKKRETFKEATTSFSAKVVISDEVIITRVMQEYDLSHAQAVRMIIHDGGNMILDKRMQECIDEYRKRHNIERSK